MRVHLSVPLESRFVREGILRATPAFVEVNQRSLAATAVPVREWWWPAPVPERPGRRRSVCRSVLSLGRSVPCPAHTVASPVTTSASSSLSDRCPPSGWSCNNPVQVLCLSDLQQPSAGVVSVRPATTQCRCCVCQTCNNPVQALCLSDLQQPSAGLVSVRPATTQCRCCVCQTCNSPLQVLCLSDLQQPSAGVVSVRPATIQCWCCVYQTANHHQANPATTQCTGVVSIRLATTQCRCCVYQTSAGIVSIRPLTIIRLILQQPSAQVLCLTDLQQSSAGIVSIRPLTIIRLILQQPDAQGLCLWGCYNHHQANPAIIQCMCCVYQTCNNPVHVLCLSDLQQPSAGVVSFRPATTQWRCCVYQTAVHHQINSATVQCTEAVSIRTFTAITLILQHQQRELSSDRDAIIWVLSAEHAELWKVNSFLKA